MITARGCFSSHSFNQRHNNNEFVLLLQPRFPSRVRSVRSSAFRRTPPILFSTNLIRTVRQRLDRCFTLPCFIPEEFASKLSVNKRKQCSECGFNPCFDGLGTSTASPSFPTVSQRLDFFCCANIIHKKPGLKTNFLSFFQPPAAIASELTECGTRHYNS